MIGKLIAGFVQKKTQNVKSTSSKLLQDLGLGFWIFVALVFVFGFFFFFNLQQMIWLIVSDYGYAGIFFLSFLSDFLVQPIGPEAPLIFGLFAGTFNPWLVLLLVILGSYFALVVAYYVGKSIGAAGVERIVGKKMHNRILASPHYGLWILFFGALTPLPYVPYLAGLWRLNLKQVLIYVALPRTISLLFIFVITYYVGWPVFQWFFL